MATRQAEDAQTGGARGTQPHLSYWHRGPDRAARRFPITYMGDTLGFLPELFQYQLVGGEGQRLRQGIQGEVVHLVQVVSGL